MIQVIEIDTVNSTILRMKINFAFCNPILIVNKNLTLEKTLDFLCFFVCTVQNWNCCMNMVVGWIVIVIQYVTYYMPLKDMNTCWHTRPPNSANSGSIKFFFSNEACQRVCCLFTSMQFIFWDGLDWILLIESNIIRKVAFSVVWES